MGLFRNFVKSNRCMKQYPSTHEFIKRVEEVLLYPWRREPALTMALFLTGGLTALSYCLSTHNILFEIRALLLLFLPNMAMSAAQAWLLAAAAAWVNKRWGRILAMLLVALPVAAQLALHFLFKLPINPTSVELLLETNGREAIEFCSLYLATPQMLLCATGIVLLCLLPELPRRWCKIWLAGTALHNRTLLTALATAGLLIPGVADLLLHTSALVCSERQLTLIDAKCWRTTMHNFALPINSISYSLGFLRLRTAQIEQQNIANREALAQGATPGDSVVVMLVVGESHIKHRSQLYGYVLPDEPWLAAQRDSGRLVAFSDCVSTHTHTSGAISNDLSLNDIGDGQRAEDYPLLPVVLRSAGWSVHIRDNQILPPAKADVTWDVGPSLQLLNRFMCDSVWSSTHDDIFNYDEQALDSSLIRGLKPRSLVFFHLIGQHQDYRARYPHEWSQFDAHDIRDDPQRPWLDSNRKLMEAQYANATLYNDHVLSRVAQCLERLDAVMLYVGDHGEEIYDYRDVLGRVQAIAGHELDFLRCQAEVPLVIW